MPSAPISPDALLTTRALSAALGEAGFPIAATTLDTKVSRGGGPPFRKFLSTRLYRWGDALEWALQQLGPAATTATERRRLERAARKAASTSP
jgi:hypothetical protein